MNASGEGGGSIHHIKVVRCVCVEIDLINGTLFNRNGLYQPNTFKKNVFSLNKCITKL